jgi:hypothetical protein
MTRLLLVALGLAALVNPALSWSDDEKLVAKMAASAALVTDFCPAYTLDPVKAGKALKLTNPDVTLAKPGYDAFIDQTMADLRGLVPYMPGLCEHVYSLFGPESPMSQFFGPAMTRR